MSDTYEPSEEAITAALGAYLADGRISRRAGVRAALVAAYEVEHPPPHVHRFVYAEIAPEADGATYLVNTKCACGKWMNRGHRVPLDRLPRWEGEQP